jgi:FdhD protein
VFYYYIVVLKSTKQSAKKELGVETLVNHSIVHGNKTNSGTVKKDLIGEEPLSIRVQGEPYSVIMRTPGDEIQHVAGFCLGEGIVDTPDDFASLSFCEGADTNVVTVTLKPLRREKIPQILERRGFISQTSCGLCGKEIVADLIQTLQPLKDSIKLDIKKVGHLLEMLSFKQPLRQKTRASHAAVIYNSDLKVLSVAEDVGRHNALDKAIGKIFLKGDIQKAYILVLSSRISYELVQKAARAQIPIILAKSRPTSLAVALALELNMTLVSDSKEDGLEIFCCAHRLLA